MSSEDRYPMMSGGRVIVTFLLIGLAVRSSDGEFFNNEKTLRDAVLRGYEYKIRPQKEVVCNVRLSLMNINILDWTDPRLTWTPSDYGNIQEFYDTELVLWRPVLIVDNEISNLDVIQSDKMLLHVSSEGELEWEPPGIYTTHCDADVTFYPFDTQQCVIQITSWSYTVNQVNLQIPDKRMLLKHYQESGEWELLDNWIDRQLVLENNHSHPRIDFHLKVRRRPTYYVMTLLFPIILTSVLCVLVFLLPVQSDEKVGYTLTILLTYVVMLTLVAGYMPPTSKTISLLSIYVTIVLFLGAFATLATVLTLYFYQHDTGEPVPGWMVNLWTKVLIPVASWEKPVAPSSTINIDVEVSRILSNFETKERESRVERERTESEVKRGSDSRQRVNVQSQPQVDEKISVVEREPSAASSFIENDASLTWQDISVIMDAALFKVLTIFIVVLTVAFLTSLILGRYFWTTKIPGQNDL